MFLSSFRLLVYRVLHTARYTFVCALRPTTSTSEVSCSEDAPEPVGSWPEHVILVFQGVQGKKDSRCSDFIYEYLS